MHECMLCERDIKKSKTVFGSGCINNIFKFLDMSKPYRAKNKEQLLYKNVIKRTHVSNINKNQKVWLTDRYLTYQYLDKLPYGDFELLKLELNTDIQNINKTKKFEDMITSQEIKLKQAYDLYKKEQKFETNLTKIKNNEYKDIDELKLLFTTISFIFNLYGNKSQYEKDAFKAMQYAFWQTVIEVGRSYFEFDISADFLQHSLEENPEDLYIEEGKVVEEIIKDKQFQENINNIVKEYGKDCKEFVFDSDNDENFPMNFDESDLYFSIHSASLKIVGKKQGKNWNLDIKLHDRYDYSIFKYPDKYYNDTNSIPKSIFSSTIYNLAYFSMKFKVMKEYNIDVHIELNDFEVIQ